MRGLDGQRNSKKTPRHKDKRLLLNASHKGCKRVLMQFLRAATTRAGGRKEPSG